MSNRRDRDVPETVVASYMGLQELPKPPSLYKVITQRRLRNKDRTITRIFFAALVKEGFSQDAEKHLVAWLDDKEKEANRIKDDHRVREAGGGRDYMEDANFSPDVGFTGFTLVSGPVIVCFLENQPNWIDDLLFYLKTEAAKSDTIYEKVKILAVNEENHERAIDAWGMSKLTDLGLVVTEIDKSNEDMCKRVCEIYRLYLDSCLDTNSKLSSSTAGFTAKLKQEFVKRVAPSGDDMSILIYSKFPSVQEYFSLFYDDEELIMEDEISFPQPAYLSEYLEYRDSPYLKYNGFKG